MILLHTMIFFLNVNAELKGIVSQDFEVCFLVPLDTSDIATPDTVHRPSLERPSLERQSLERHSLE
jgi:hypothetical protein